MSGDDVFTDPMESLTLEEKVHKLIETVEENDFMVECEIKNILENLEITKKEFKELVDDSIAVYIASRDDDYLNLKRSYKALQSKCDKNLSEMKKIILNQSKIEPIELNENQFKLINIVTIVNVILVFNFITSVLANFFKLN